MDNGQWIMDNYLNIDAMHCVATEVPIFFILQFILMLLSFNMSLLATTLQRLLTFNY